MRLLCDANIGRTIARALAAAGHDVLEGPRRFEGVPDNWQITDRMTVIVDGGIRQRNFPRKS